MNKKAECLYNKYFFEQLHKYMLQEQVDTALDGSNTTWHLMDVEKILIDNYGYQRASNGSIL